MSEYLQLPHDLTYEEAMILDIVKEKMLQRLDDRQKFLFLYCYELGHDQLQAARLLEVSPALITRYFERIRHALAPFKEGYVNNTL